MAVIATILGFFTAFTMALAQRKHFQKSYFNNTFLHGKFNIVNGAVHIK